MSIYLLLRNKADNPIQQSAKKSASPLPALSIAKTQSQRRLQIDYRSIPPRKTKKTRSTYSVRSRNNQSQLSPHRQANAAPPDGGQPSINAYFHRSVGAPGRRRTFASHWMYPGVALAGPGAFRGEPVEEWFSGIGRVLPHGWG